MIALLGALHVDGSRALFAVFDVKGDGIALAELLELDALQRFAVEEQILLLSFSTDEAEATVGKLFDNTIHSIVYVNA